MSTNRRQTLEATYVAVPAPTRRRCLPPRPRVPVPMSLHQRWRYRPRCRALHLTPACRDGVVHAIVGRVACPCLSAQIVRDNRATGAAMVVPSCERRSGRRLSLQSVRARALFSRRIRRRSEWRSSHTTIAPMMLAPCSASSMLSAPLRPGRWPGLRALTTPARGTVWQLRDGDRSMTAHNHVDANLARAYGGLISSVPHGTPPVRHNGIRSAHSADAPRARFRAQPSRHRS
jgi:hypothetical protein